ncbi:ATP-binding protein [Pseudoduganella sp. SL102]|uniref:ATP-binding protein n=1 Tax=Pseudoduganella sp. SL102 TaxID=2995154 RepID=UPI00248B7A26|nr:ATP-binding protein [Pseudoduganella sp. SL102]WBS02907.1 ATP-binding protein [Pseudoduganella sp. SL102]
MLRILFRIYFLTAIALVVFGYIVAHSVRQHFSSEMERYALDRTSGEIFLLGKYLDSAPPSEWLARFDDYKRRHFIRVSLIPMKEAQAHLSQEKIARLQHGEWVANISPEAYFGPAHRPPAPGEPMTDDVIRFDPVGPKQVPMMVTIGYTSLALLMMLPMALWARHLWKELDSLSKTARSFGEGQLAARAAIAKRSPVYPLAECINDMATRIESLLCTQKELVHSVSHELRTPITRLDFGFEMLLKQTGGDGISSRIRSMQGDLAQLNELVNELLQLGRLDQPQALMRSPVDLIALLSDCASAARHELGAKQLELDLPPLLAAIEADARLIDRAVGNVLRNAAKYAERQVRLSAVKVGDGIDIVIDDDGPGIPAAERDRIFEPFYRLDRSRDRTTGGFGLGLAIAAKAMTLHGGTIAASDSRTGGARFVMHFPV